MIRPPLNGIGTSDLAKSKKAKALRQEAQHLFLQAYYGEHKANIEFIAKVRTENLTVTELNPNYRAQILSGKLNRRSAERSY